MCIRDRRRCPHHRDIPSRLELLRTPRSRQEPLRPMEHQGMTEQFPPVFATNRPEDGSTVAGEINRLLATLRREYAAAPNAAIATAYLNPGGFSLLSLIHI